MSDVLTSALDLASRGMFVFPIDSPELEKCAGIGQGHYPDTCADRGKHPCVPFTKQATTDAHQIAAWFTGYPRNLGIACGASGLLVIDEDTPGDLARYAATVGGTIPPTFTVSTGRGSHFYFQAGDHDLGNAEAALKSYGVNVRGRGGYVVGPGSLHATGALYGIALDVPPAPLPAWLLEALRPPQAAAGTTVDWSTWDDKPRGLTAVPEVIRGPREKVGGERHEVLVRYACSLRGRDVPLAEAEPLFRLVWQRCEQPPTATSALPWDDARAKLLDVYARYAVTTPRPEVIILQGDDATEAALEAAHALAVEVEREAFRLRVREAARAKVDAEKADATAVPPFDAGLLVDVLARPQEPPHRAEGLIPSDAGTLVVAQRKTGKTTLLLNLARSLVLGGDFLGRFPIRPVTGRVGFLNFEVSAAQLARWAHEAGVPGDRLYLVNLRGRRNPFTLDADREHLAQELRAQEVESLIVDPFGRAYVGKSQNDPGEVGAWLADLDRFARGDAGVSDVVLAAHAGWDGERTRGSSALEDWADSIVTLVRDKDDDQGRYLRAEGRDVLVEEDRLDFDPMTRTLRMAGAGSRKTAAKVRHLEELVPAVVGIVEASPGITGYKIGQALRAAEHAFQKGDESKAAKLAAERGLLVAEPGSRNSTTYRIASPPRPPHTSPAGKSDDLPDPPYRGEVVSGEVNGDDLPATRRSWADLLTVKPTPPDPGPQPCERCAHPNADYLARAYCSTCWADLTRKETANAS